MGNSFGANAKSSHEHREALSSSPKIERFSPKISPEVYNLMKGRVQEIDEGVGCLNISSGTKEEIIGLKNEYQPITGRDSSLDYAGGSLSTPTTNNGPGFTSQLSNIPTAQSVEVTDPLAELRKKIDREALSVSDMQRLPSDLVHVRTEDLSRGV
jgi:hypothetical protein